MDNDEALAPQRLDENNAMVMKFPGVANSLYQLDVYADQEQGAHSINLTQALYKQYNAFSYPGSGNHHMPRNFSTRVFGALQVGLFYEIYPQAIYVGLYAKAPSSILTDGWIGLIYGTKSIANSDCALAVYDGVSLSSNFVFGIGQVLDMRIYGGGWPYEDVSAAINSTDDLVLVNSVISEATSANDFSLDTSLPAFFVSYLRDFDTGDKLGDSVI